MGGTAAECEATGQGLERLRRRGWRLIAVGTGAFVVGAVGVGILGSAWLGRVAAYCLLAGVATALLGAFALVNLRRMTGVLRAGPWVACAAEYFPPLRGGAAVVLRQPGSGELLAFPVVTTRLRNKWADPGPPGVLWWCGAPQAGGVVSQPGGHEPVRIRPLRTVTGQWRRRILEAAQYRGILTRAEPGEPHGTPPSSAHD